MAKFKVTYGDQVEIVVRRPTVRDDLHSQILAKKLQADVPDGAFGYWALFADLCGSTESARGLPFDPVRLHDADSSAIQVAYEQFLDLDSVLKERWNDALIQAKGKMEGGVALDPN